MVAQPFWGESPLSVRCCLVFIKNNICHTVGPHRGNDSLLRPHQRRVGAEYRDGNMTQQPLWIDSAHFWKNFRFWALNCGFQFTVAGL